MKKEIRIALVAIVALIVLYFGLSFLKGASMFTDNNVYYLAFKDVAGVAKNCAIYAGGVAVGEVDAITYDYTHEKPTQVTALLRKKMVVPEGTKAEVKTDLMGNTQVNLILGDAKNAPIPPGGTIMGKEDDGIMDQLGSMVPVIDNMLPKLDSIFASINELMADPALKSILTNTKELTAELNKASAQLTKLSIALNKEVPTLLAQTNELLGSTDKMAKGLAEVDVKNTMDKVNATIEELQTTVNQLNSPEGTLGKLINDSQLYDNLTATMADADSLVTDLKAHPKRYVHFSVFGKKD